jgi:hypothetical protein
MSRKVNLQKAAPVERFVKHAPTLYPRDQAEVRLSLKSDYVAVPRSRLACG